jgi:apolipoprotein D and lipocalin family protein
MKSTIFIYILVLLATIFTRHTLEASTTLTSLLTVEHVDLNRYAGVWYDVAHYANKFQENCQDGTTTFSIRKDGDIDILNTCHDKHDGTLHHANGHGWVVDTTSNARLKFSFFWPFRNEYLIIDQGKDYEYSVIGTPDRKRLWIIARSPIVDNVVFESIMQHIEKQGFSRENLIKR